MTCWLVIWDSFVSKLATYLPSGNEHDDMLSPYTYKVSTNKTTVSRKLTSKIQLTMTVHDMLDVCNTVSIVKLTRLHGPKM